MNEHYHFFWDGPFSQWYESPFTIDKIKFNCAEQFMMYKKATHFDDYATASMILIATSPRNQKKLGRSVTKFNADEWNRVAKQYVLEGNIAKFSQNVKLLDILLNTGDKLFVEASPFDKIWGIGLDAKTAAETPSALWSGTNWLGEVLDEVKEHFRAQTTRT
jgi:ribA/ribD-fused uncharacterized protein